MTAVIGWLGDVFGMNLGVIGTTDVTLGLVLAWTLVIFIGLSVFRRVRGR